MPGANATAVTFKWEFSGIAVLVQYRLVSSQALFVEKQLQLEQSSDPTVLRSTLNITKVVLFDHTLLANAGSTPQGGGSLVASSHYGLGDYAVFHRFDAGEA